MTRKQKRLTMIGAIGAVLMAAVLLVMFALRDEIVFFYSPTDILTENKARSGERFRLGGLVEVGTLMRGASETVSFNVTDGGASIPVRFTGVLPDLFAEGQGMIGTGRMEGGIFVASEILAKHDENYMPREVIDSLKEQGVYEDPNS